MNCPFCQEEVFKDDDKFASISGDIFHRECLLRSVVGSAGHQLEQCSCFGQEDHSEEGLTKRNAARLAQRVYGARKKLGLDPAIITKFAYGKHK